MRTASNTGHVHGSSYVKHAKPVGAEIFLVTPERVAFTSLEVTLLLARALSTAAVLEKRHHTCTTSAATSTM